ncbi:D-alanyl-D-alanine carboxypeptidase [Modicisalibacter muralis]|uniref:D-alanyl-D-alanine carboxypeptidase n=1 Tax=Modicisalibacter muralis TaxID=119000 RepID=A0A1G9I5E7_9GAMM|nr:D-alanyl-D-alanine carboxypeptidase [Halomonas muralis]SDL20467.1 D-alanyl-D-alanine carboxypeptidase [Halomonas muralis]
MAPIHSYATSRGFGAFLVVWFIGLALLCAPSAQADNPRYAGIVVDIESDVVLYADNAREPRYPASLTKMMTLYLLFEALEDNTLTLDDTFPVSSYAASQPASKLWVQPGDRISVEKAILALIVTSANDVAVVVAEGLAGSEESFAVQMTDKAWALGMKDTVFSNASGLPDDAQVTTARDMLMLALHLIEDFPQYYDYFSRTRYTYNGTMHTGHNRLLSSYAGVDGLKTGYIRASGFNVATSAVRGDRRIAGVVMGGFTSRSRDAHMADLLNRSFARAAMMNQGDWVAQTDLFGGPGLSSPDNADTSGETLVAASDTGAQDDPIRALIAQSERDGELSSSVLSDVWAVQVGAFSNREGAQQLATQAVDYLSTELSEARSAVMPAQGEQRIFRARVIGLQESQARQSCQQLMQRGMDCLVVRGEGG